MDVSLYTDWCVAEPRRHLCESQGARGGGGGTSLHQQCSEALSLSRSTSLLRNAVVLQNKQIPTFSAFTHRPQSSRAWCVDMNLQQNSRLANFKMSFLTATVNYN